MAKQTGITETLATRIYVRRFDTKKAADRAELETLKKLFADRHCHGPVWAGEHSYHEKLRALDGTMVHLEQGYLFGNQWNTVEGFRVFDFAIHQWPNNRSLFDVQWLELDERHAQLRREWTKCGYCGALEHAPKGYVFCPHCLGSEYLKREDLKLTRMRPVADEDSGPRPELTEAEAAHLVPLYIEAQTHGNTERDKARIAKARADLVKERDTAIRVANTKHDGFMWLMDRGIKTDNVIYYSHTDRFSFGWRQPVDADVVSRILDVISEFPFQYEIKCADGRTLSN